MNLNTNHPEKSLKAPGMLLAGAQYSQIQISETASIDCTLCNLCKAFFCAYFLILFFVEYQIDMFTGAESNVDVRD